MRSSVAQPGWPSAPLEELHRACGEGYLQRRLHWMRWCLMMTLFWGASGGLAPKALAVSPLATERTMSAVAPSPVDVRLMISGGAELEGWVPEAPNSTFAATPEELELVYGPQGSFFRKWKVVSAATRHYVQEGRRLKVFASESASEHDAMLLYAYQREAAVALGDAHDLPLKESAFWSRFAGKLDAWLWRGRYLFRLQAQPERLVDPESLARTLGAISGRAPLFSPASRVVVNGQEVALSKPLLLVGEYAFVPVGPVLDYLGFEKSWDSRSLQATFADRKMRFQVKHNSSLVTTSDGYVQLDRPAFLLEDTLYAPAELLTKVAGYAVRWEGNQKRLVIETQ